MIIAIEGVSCSGKTTLATRLADPFGWQVVPCYYHVAADPGLLGEPLATSEDEQLAALTAHLLVEAERRHRADAALARDGAVILDRSIDTLLAHLTAVGQLQGLDVPATVSRARTLIDQAVSAGTAVVPDLTLLLIATPTALATRGVTRPDVPRLYYDPNFAAHFNQYFADPISPRCMRLDANADPAALLSTARTAISRTAGILAEEA
ncbi:dTMP kinase [Acrocarpospora macrocephala]|uniref:dTMP kinase n=1 Tax=Acrocarpospora macrocephala TaxID=150177 RepID=UPI001478FEB5|nr:AAA family ATPase [Acrocarpospora macrocephala]